MPWWDAPTFAGCGTTSSGRGSRTHPRLRFGAGGKHLLGVARKGPRRRQDAHHGDCGEAPDFMVVLSRYAGLFDCGDDRGGHRGPGASGHWHQALPGAAALCWSLAFSAGRAADFYDHELLCGPGDHWAAVLATAGGQRRSSPIVASAAANGARTLHHSRVLRATSLWRLPTLCGHCQAAERGDDHPYHLSWHHDRRCVGGCLPRRGQVLLAGSSARPICGRGHGWPAVWDVVKGSRSSCRDKGWRAADPDLTDTSDHSWGRSFVGALQPCASGALSAGHWQPAASVHLGAPFTPCDWGRTGGLRTSSTSRRWILGQHLASSRGALHPVLAGVWLRGAGTGFVGRAKQETDWSFALEHEGHGAGAACVANRQGGSQGSGDWSHAGWRLGHDLPQRVSTGAVRRTCAWFL